MSELYQNSLFAGVTISLLAYALGMFLRKKLKLGIFNPLLISFFWHVQELNMIHIIRAQPI